MIRFVYEPGQNRSAAYDGDCEIGECQYDVSGKKWIIYHTGVNPAYGGQGYARQLVNLVGDAAEAAGVEIISTCSYARIVLGR